MNSSGPAHPDVPGAAVLAIGESMIMLSPAQGESLADAASLNVGIAGAESTVALYLQDLGHRSIWVSRVGADPFGQRILADIARRGVDTSFVAIDRHAPTGVFVKDPRPHDTAVHYYRRGSAASKMSAQSLSTLPFDDAEFVHTSGITCALSRSCAQMMQRLPLALHRRRASLSFDVNYRTGLWPASIAAVALRRQCAVADLVFVGLDEARTLWQTETAQQVRDLLSEPEILVVKDGAVGASEFCRTTTTFVPTPDVPVIEVTGAGDAFAAGYLSALLRGEPARRRLQTGHQLAARAMASTDDYLPVLS
jgi:2-dehydro-3-deoxygluconokinase